MVCNFSHSILNSCATDSRLNIFHSWKYFYNTEEKQSERCWTFFARCLLRCKCSSAKCGEGRCGLRHMESDTCPQMKLSVGAFLLHRGLCSPFHLFLQRKFLSLQRQTISKSFFAESCPTAERLTEASLTKNEHSCFPLTHLQSLLFI